MVSIFQSRKEYQTNVCGLLFTEEDDPRIVLAFREQQGIYDGLGGSVRWPDVINEQVWERHPRRMLASLVYDQASIVTTPEQWEEIITIRVEGGEIRFYWTIDLAAINAERRNAADDQIVLDNPYILPMNIVSHLRWIVPLALDENIVKPLGLQSL